MKILALEKEMPGATSEQFRARSQAEARRVWELYLAGVVRETYFRADRNEAVLVLECASAVEAQEALATLPMVKAGLIEFEIISLAPYPGFGRLFGES